MPKAYSIDLRERVIKYIEQGNNYIQTSSIYEISRETARKWHRRWKAEGHCNLKPRPGKKSRIVRSEFECYVSEHPGATLSQIGKHFGIRGQCVHYYMKKFNYNYKKKSLAIWKQKKSKEINTDKR